MRVIAGFLAVFVAALAAAAPPGGPTRAEIDALGPRVGQAAPDFSLPDQHGQRHTLRSILGPNGAMLVFFRSADW
jgi:cytochrome oxidase Cu insertion factor (SCO1/SenC/PrrC family)